MHPPAKKESNQESAGRRSLPFALEREGRPDVADASERLRLSFAVACALSRQRCCPLGVRRGVVPLDQSQPVIARGLFFAAVTPSRDAEYISRLRQAAEV